MKSLILIALFTFGHLNGQGIIQLVRFDTTTTKGIEEFSNSLKMVSSQEFKADLLVEIEKRTNEKLTGELSAYIEIDFQPYRNMVLATGKGAHSNQIEEVFTKTFIDYRLKEAIGESMREVEAQRIAADSLKQQLEATNLGSSKRKELERQYQQRVSEMTKIKAEVVLDGGPQWRILQPTSR